MSDLENYVILRRKKAPESSNDDSNNSSSNNTGYVPNISRSCKACTEGIILCPHNSSVPHDWIDDRSNKRRCGGNVVCQHFGDR